MNEENRQFALSLLLTLLDKENPQNRDDAERILNEGIKKFSSVNMIEISAEEESEELKDAVYKEYRFPTMPGSSIVSEDVKNDKWLDEREDQDFPYTKRFRSYMNGGHGPSRSAVEAMLDDSRKIIQMLGDPSKRGFIRKGLLLGDVQSGKTGNYTAVMNRAVDVGYNVIILLAGTTDSLRTQTQRRIDRDLVGFTKDKSGAIGVGLQHADEGFVRKVRPITSTLADFSKKVADTIQLQIGSETLLFVTKKNVKTMSAIRNSLFEANRVSGQDKLNASVLIIDDESDYASVNTNDETDPSHTNAEIRQMLNMFSRGSYLAVTATPYANIFIDSIIKTEKEGYDLFPSNFIHMLSRPEGYTGALKLFGNVEMPGSGGRTYKEECLEHVKPEDMEVLPFKHKKTAAEKIRRFSDLPLKLQESIRYFLLVQRLMDYLPNSVKYRSMMINVSRFVKVQNKITEVISDWLKTDYIPQIKQACRIEKDAERSNSFEFRKAKEVWVKFHLSEKSGMTFEEFAPEMLGNIDRLSVVAVNNSRAGCSTLDYTKNDERYIAVGGQCLSRGLTLESLVVSFFYRNSVAYDTLLQMCRWFGYRDRYLRYFKVWLSDDSVDWYSAITDATEDLRSQIEDMNSKNLSPQQFGLMVEYNPGTGLIITARNKMRNAEASNKIPVDLIGQLIETPRLYIDSGIDKANSQLIGSLIDKLCSINGDYRFVESGEEQKFNRSMIWRNVSKDVIADFVNKFKADYLSYGYKIDELSDYIRENSTPEWSVVIQQISSPEDAVDFHTPSGRILKLVRSKRTYDDKSKSMFDGRDIIRISGHSVKVGSGTVARLPLLKEQLDQMKQHYGLKWKSKEQNSSTYLISLPDSKDNLDSVLILYPIRLKKNDEQVSVNDTKDNEIKWAIGLGFAGDKPAQKEEQCFVYYLNSVAIKKKDSDQNEENDE